MSESTPELNPPPQAVALFRKYLKEPARSLEKMFFELDEYLVLVEKVAERNPRVDDALAFRIAEAAREILRAAPPDHYKYAQAATRYFIEDEDAEADLVTPNGFDDDILVLNSVARHMGRPDLQFIEEA